MLVGGEMFLRRKSHIPGSHQMWDATMDLQARMEGTRTESAADQYHFISFPFQHSSLKNLASHIHPFCVIMKASQALSKSLHLLPSELLATAVKIIAVGSRWSNSFPTSDLRAISSNHSPSTPSRRNLCSAAPYQVPGWLPAVRIGVSHGGMDVTGGGVGANRSFDADAVSTEEELHLTQNEESMNYPQPLLVGLTVPFSLT